MSVEQYAEAIEQIGQLLSSKCLINEEHNTLLLKIDSVLRMLFAEVAKQIVVTISEELVSEKVNELKEQGLRPHRSSEVPFHFLYGSLKLKSPYLWDKKRKMGVKPLAECLKVPAHTYTPALQKALVDFGIEESFSHATQRFTEHYGWEPSTSALRRFTLKMGEEAQEYVDTRLVQTQNDFEQNEHDRPGVDEMIVELDGCFLRTAELVKKRGRGKTKVRKIQKKRRVEEYKEVRVGLARSIDDVKKVAVAKMSGYPEICQQLFEASIEAGLSSKTQVVGIADGGNGLLEELQTHFPDMTFILDVFHLKENMYETADAMGFVEKEKEQWVKQRFSMIFKGKVEKALALMKEDLLKSGVNERLERLIGYIEKFKEGMSYKEFKERGWPIGSGEVESAHRYIPQKRMKLPGAWWKKEHINPMLAMRVVRANGWWDSFWAEKDQLLEIAS